MLMWWVYKLKIGEVHYEVVSVFVRCLDGRCTGMGLRVPVVGRNQRSGDFYSSLGLDSLASAQAQVFGVGVEHHGPNHGQD